MDLLLHTPNATSGLRDHYKRAFQNAIELFIVTAYLTEWDDSLKLNPGCTRFRVIVGKDFGITRKAACEKTMAWLPKERKSQFKVADEIAGFHPKAVFWKEKGGNCYAIVGSSNLTRAAFETNYEVNVFSELSKAQYIAGKNWVKQIEKHSVVMSNDWLKNYKEALARPQSAKGTKKGEPVAAPLVTLKLPRPPGTERLINSRRGNLAAYKKKRTALIRLFRRCAKGDISSDQFYQTLTTYWSPEVGDRLQGRGWERRGKDSDFQALSRSFVKILDAADQDRDDVVRFEIDALRDQNVPARAAFLSEMLCLNFPDEYPVLDTPVWNYLKHVKFRGPRGASEGAHYIHLATTLRASLLQNPGHPAKNLAELDTVIWLAHGKKRATGS
jgi:HKD family nuclease